MNDFVIDFEWLDPLGPKGPELTATFARLSITVGQEPVTRVYEKRSKAVRDAVYVPLYPLAEWLAGQWWALWNEAGVVRPGYDSRHSLVSAREGYALPPLRIEPAGSIVTLSWFPERLPFHGVEFIGRGESSTQTRIVKDKLSSLINAVVSRLEANGINDSLLQQDWAAIQSADQDETTFCECAGALGLDPYSLNDRQQREIEQVGHQLPTEIVSEFFNAARAEQLSEDANAIVHAVAIVQNNDADLGPLKDLHRVAITWDEPQGSTPWEQGYSFAQQLRAYLALDGKPLKSMASIAEALGADLDQALSHFSTTLPFVALTGINHKFSPTFVIKRGLEPSRMFHFCRALFEYLYARRERSALITDAKTEQQKRNRAFAAELLAPASALRERVKTRIVTEEQTEELAQELGVSAWIISHQLKNHRIADVEPA